jgi:membrane peptidoglycan carboxypeptidase
VQIPAADSYFVEEVKQRLLNDPVMGATREERVARHFDGGSRIYTTIEPQAQRAAEQAVAVPPRTTRDQQALVSLDRTGAVSLVGGGLRHHEVRRGPLEPGRQTGSLFKTFVLLTALEQGTVRHHPRRQLSVPGV